MSTLRIEQQTFLSADFGRESPLPEFDVPRHWQFVDAVFDTTVPHRERRSFQYGQLPNSLPYSQQIDYDRIHRPREFTVAIMENDYITATFLPELGGRLWSLYDKPSKQELVYTNSVIQPANLAIRNAWFAGGVEWNMGIRGHSPFTCSPVFAAHVAGPDGTPILRLYEFERIRRCPWQIDIWLPPYSRYLFVHVRLTNPNDVETPMYWWSNIAAVQSEKTRILTPAEDAIHRDYTERAFTLQMSKFPGINGIDRSYPARSKRANDYFFRINDGDRPWIAVVDGDGAGTVHTSTQRLAGRKLFQWGTGSGSEHWQDFLSVDGRRYLEIQAGLARTQMEYLPMPPGAEWSWTEAYGPIQISAIDAHHTDWHHATAAASNALDTALPAATLEYIDQQIADCATQPPTALLHHGSGWGALEDRRRHHCSAPPLHHGETPYPAETFTHEQQPWLELLTEKKMVTDITSFMVQPEWHVMAEDAVTHVPSASLWFHLTLMRYYAGDTAGARDAAENALACERNWQMLRNLARVELLSSNTERAAGLIIEACRLAPTELPLVIECGQLLLSADQPARWLEFVTELPSHVRETTRVRLLAAQAYLKVGNLTAIDAFFATAPTLIDNREGEKSLSRLWVNAHAYRLAKEQQCEISDVLRQEARRRFPLPPGINFDMATE